MRRIFAFIVVISALVMSTIAGAEQFTIHSGTTFGMNYNEINSLENSKGFHLLDQTDDMSQCAEFLKSVYPYTELPYDKLYAARGTIAGINGATISYYLQDDKVTTVVYHLDNKGTSGGGSTAILKTYNSIYSSLNLKYGSPENWLGVTYFPNRLVPAFLESEITVYSNGEEGYHAYWFSSIIECSSWTIQLDDGSFALVFLVANNGRDGSTCFLNLCYIHIPADEYSYAEQKLKESVTQAMDDL